MRKTFISFLLIFVCFSLTAGNSPDSISTIYKDGEFISNYQTKVAVKERFTSEVADYLVNDFHNSPDNLFNWALKNLGLQNKNDELIFVLKTSVTDNKTGITYGGFDIVVKNITTFKDIKVNAIVSNTKYTSGVTKVSADIIYSSLLLKKAVGTVIMIPQNNNEQLFITNVNIKFGWFFNIFITKKRYKSIVEWRIKKFTENLKSECLKRQAMEISK